VKPEVLVFSSAREAAAQAAAAIGRVLRRPGRPLLVLASGKTMVPVYRELVRLHAAARAPFRRARTFNLDELAVGPGDPRSFRSFMDRHLFHRVGLDPKNVHFLRGDAGDLDAEAARYERDLARAGVPDLALVGVGANGHVAYLEPGRSLAPRTSPVRLSASTRRSLAADGLRPVPHTAVTMGIETILSARKILLLATGSGKRAAIAKALKGPVSPRCPASFLSLHPGLTVVLDRAAADW
jgi:glucosamine-6-phosphate deaminase